MFPLKVVRLATFVIFFVQVDRTFSKATTNSLERIVGGEKAPNTESLFVVSIQDRFGNHFCAGSILSEYWVLSAAHCFQETRNQKGITIVAGTYQLSGGGSRHDVDLIAQYRPFLVLPSNVINDIALVKLVQPIEFNDKVKSIELPKTNIKAGTTVTLYGWGVTKYGADSLPNDLLTLKRVVMSNPTCQRELIYTIGAMISNKQMCTIPSTDAGPCSGDSGGPIINGNSVIGIVSFGYKCATKVPDVYTRVFSYVNWIKYVTCYY